MTKINLNTAPYFDDFDENKKFYKILFRPGRSVQVRELNQLQSILQNQIARLGGFTQGDIVHPSGTVGARFNNTAVFVKAVRNDNQTSFIANEEQIKRYWLGKEVTSQIGVTGKIIGFDINGNDVRFFIDLKSASASTGKKNFYRKDTISTTPENSDSPIKFVVDSVSNSTGRIARVEIPTSIYFHNQYFVLVDEQTLFLTPDNKNIDSNWNTSVTCDVGIKMVESVVRHDQDESILDNASGSSNYGGAGADRLRIEGTLTKRPRQTIEQDFIVILSLEDGGVVDAPLVDKESLGIKSDAEARRIYEESGNYMVAPFTAASKPFLDTDDPDGLYSEFSELSWGFTEEDDINEDQARDEALKCARTLFKMGEPKATKHENRYYPGNSYDDPGDPQSFKSMCNSMIGLRIEPGVAYVQGYRVARAGISKIGVKKAQTSDYISTISVPAYVGQFILIKDVIGCPEINDYGRSDGWYYDDIELHSKILDITNSRPTIPDSTTKIGSARVCSIGIYTDENSNTLLYQLGVFDVNIESGYSFNDVKSIYSNGKSSNGKDFVANLVLQDSQKNPKLIFTGTIEKVTNPYAVQAKEAGDGDNTDNPVIGVEAGSKAITLDFEKLQNRDECYRKFSLGSAIKFNTSNLVRLITDVQKDDTQGTPQSGTTELTDVNGTSKGPFTLRHTPILDSNLKVYYPDDPSNPVESVVKVDDYDGSTLTDSNQWQINGLTKEFWVPHRPIEERSTRVVVSVKSEKLDQSLVNGTNRTFPIANSPIGNVVTVYTKNLTPTNSPRTLVESTYYQVSNGKLTFITRSDGTNKIPLATQSVEIEYTTYIESINLQNNKIVLVKAPVVGSTLAVSYSYRAYTVDNAAITFAEPPEAGTIITYKYLPTRRVKITLDDTVPFDNSSNTIKTIQITKKVIGKGTTWKSDVTQFLEKGDWVQIGTDSNKKIYQVFSTPTNDNELNLDPDPLETELVDGERTLINAPWPDGAKMTYLIPQNIRDSSGSSNTGLIYKLPHQDIATIRGGSKNNISTDTTAAYTVRRYITADSVSGDITINLSSTTESAVAFNTSLYSLVDLTTGIWFKLFPPEAPDQEGIGPMIPSDPSTFKAKVIVTSTANTQSITFKTSRNPADGITDRKYAVIIPVRKKLKEGTKTLYQGDFTGQGGSYTNGRSGAVGADAGFVVANSEKDVSSISLGKADIVRVTRIVCAEDIDTKTQKGKYATAPTEYKFSGPSWTDASGIVHRDITGAYSIDNGQRDFYYGIGKVTLREGMPVPQGQVRVEFDYYEHPTSGFDYFSVDSYTESGLSYRNIPTYTSSSGIPFDLRSCIDFRPIVNQVDSSRNGLQVFLNYKESPIDFFTCSYHVYEGRKDLLYISKDGELLVKQGEPSLNPQYPVEPIDGMSIYSMELSPFTESAFDVRLQQKEHRRYTMRDIGLLETRIKNLENYTSLTLLEKSTKDLVIKDSTGLDKFKHGFMIDTFESPTKGDITNPEFRTAYDMVSAELKPTIEEFNVPLIESVYLIRSDESSDQTERLQEQEREQRNYARADKNTPEKKTSFYTLRYDNVTFAEQPLCSRVININPYAVQSFIGSLKINPWTDTWREINKVDDRNQYDSSAYDYIARGYNADGQKIDWDPAVKTHIGKTDTGLVPDGRINVVGATMSWPVKVREGGKYLIFKHKKDPKTGNMVFVWELGSPERPKIDKKRVKVIGADGKTTYEWKDVFVPGTEQVKIPDGYPGAGQVVPFYWDSGFQKDDAGNKYRNFPVGLKQDGYTRTISDKYQETRTGRITNLIDGGYVETARIKDRVIDTSAASLVRQNVVEFTGRGFFPNTQLYAFFDDIDVTQYCYPDNGFGGVEEDEANQKVFKGESISLKFGTNTISTWNDGATNALLEDLTIDKIKVNPKFNFAMLTGTVTTRANKLIGSFSELVPPSSQSNYSYENFTINTNDIIQGEVSGARGRVISVSDDKKTIYFDALTRQTDGSDLPFNSSGENIRVTNEETVEVKNETPTKSSSNDYTFTLSQVPILQVTGSTQKLVLTLREESQYFQTNETATRDATSNKIFTTQHNILQGTLVYQFVRTPTWTPSQTVTFTTSNKTITFNIDIPSDVQVKVTYEIASATNEPNPTTHSIDSSYYEITENSKVIKFKNNKSPAQWKNFTPQNKPNKKFTLLASYTYAGSNYSITNESATLSTLNEAGKRKIFTTKHSILPGTLTYNLLNGTPAEDAPIVATTSNNTITFNVDLKTASGDPIDVRVNYATNAQIMLGRQGKSGTRFSSELIAATPTTSGSVVAFSGTSEEREITRIINNAEAEMSSALTADISTAVECLDKLEAIQIKYLQKNEKRFIDISRASDNSRNILNTEIKSISYKPNDANNKLTFTVNNSGMRPTPTFENVTLYIKNTAVTAGQNSNRKVTLKCDSGGTIKGRFCIPDPNEPSNPRFFTGDKTFRLTDSKTNSNLPSVSRAEAGYSARGWVDTVADDVIFTKRYTEISGGNITREGEITSYDSVFKEWGQVCQADPVAQSFQVSDKSGVFITAIDVFFYSKSPNLPVELQIRPLSDGGMPSSRLLYTMSLEANEVVVNKVNVRDGTVTVYGATSPNAREGFNKGPWNTPQTQQNGIYSVNSYAYDKGMSYTILDGNSFTPREGQRNEAAIEYGFGDRNELKNAQSHMIPTRFVLEYPLYLKGDKSNYCFVLLTNSVPGGNDVGALESTYQVYFAQQGKVYDHETLSTPVHRQAPLLEGEEDINFVLGTNEVITRIPQSEGQLFKSQNGISWTGDPIADLKYKIHKANFDTTKSAEIVFTNDSLNYTKLGYSPFATRKGSSKVRVKHPNHGFCPNSLVSFTGVEGDLNGLMPQQIIEPKVHTIESVAMDSYVIDLGSDKAAFSDGNVGGFNVRASTNIRFEELAIIADPIVVKDTNLTWRISGLSGAGPDDIEGQKQENLYSKLDDIAVKARLMEPMPKSMVVCSDSNENKIQPLGANAEPWDNKSLKLIATLSSSDPNVSPAIDTDRLSLIAKSVRLNNPYGIGFVNNINDLTFDMQQILPSTSVPGDTLRNKIWFSDTDNKLTGSSFELNYRTVTGVGSLFTVEVSVGDVVKSPVNGETRRVVEVIDDKTLTIDSPFTILSGTQDVLINPTPNSITITSLSVNPPNLRIKTADQDVASELKNIKIGTHLALYGTFDGERDFYDRLVTSVMYTPAATAIDPELGAPKLCEVILNHTLRDGVEAGYEAGSSNQQLTMISKTGFVDDISTSGTSTMAKYICKDMILLNPANTLKIMFDGCRPVGSDIELYYMTTEQNVNISRSPIWTKLEFSTEQSGIVVPSIPENDADHNSFRGYEANAIGIKPFISAKVKIVLRGGDCAKYPKVRNLRILALEE